MAPRLWRRVDGAWGRRGCPGRYSHNSFDGIFRMAACICECYPVCRSVQGVALGRLLPAPADRDSLQRSRLTDGGKTGDQCRSFDISDVGIFLAGRTVSVDRCGVVSSSGLGLAGLEWNRRSGHGCSHPRAMASLGTLVIGLFVGIDLI